MAYRQSAIVAPHRNTYPYASHYSECLPIYAIRKRLAPIATPDYSMSIKIKLLPIQRCIIFAEITKEYFAPIAFGVELSTFGALPQTSFRASATSVGISLQDGR